MMTDIKGRVNLCSLEQGVKYPVIKFIKCETQFGRQILAELEECTAFLPKRVSVAIDDNCLVDLNKKQLVLVVRGHAKTKNGSTPLVEINEA